MSFTIVKINTDNNLWFIQTDYYAFGITKTKFMMNLYFESKSFNYLKCKRLIKLKKL